ncbi:MAG: polysaccharide biosynthesis tyrosine autokinase, partial [Sphingobacteriales bacterium]
MNVNAQDGTSARQQEIDNFRLGKFVRIAVGNWWVFLLSVVIAMTIALSYLRYTTPIYNVTSRIMVQDDKKGNVMAESAMMSELGLRTKSNVDNEAEIFKSRTLMKRVVEEMRLNASVITEGRVKKTEVYGKSVPFLMDWNHLKEDSLGSIGNRITITKLSGATFKITANDKIWQGVWGKPIELPIGDITFKINQDYVGSWDKECDIILSRTDAAVAQNLASLNVTIPNKLVSIVELSFNTSVPDKGEDILDKLVEVYLKANVDDKNRIADSTISFIDDRLSLVTSELTDIEKGIEQFKTKNELTNLTEEARALISNTSDFDRQLTQQEVQLSIVRALEKHLQENDKRMVPASLVLEGKTFADLISSYNATQLDRERLLLSTTESNPMVQNLDQRLQSIRTDLINSISGFKRNLEVSITDLRNRSNNVMAKIRQIPIKERLFIDISRQQSIKQELYLFLLKKREETAVTKSSTIANARIIDAAKSAAEPFSPKRNIVYLFAFSLGLFGPAAWLYLRELLNTRVMFRTDVTDICSVPIMGEIGHNQEEKIVAVDQGVRTVIAEQFRSLRTNLQFLLTSKIEKTVMVTSSMSGEGKSFVSINLAVTLALSGKRVILLELDLRKPKVSQALGLDNSSGFSNHIIGQKTLEEIIVPSHVQPNLFVLPSGPIPPNPAELLMLPTTDLMFEQLRKDFDYIVIDTAPSGLVTDAFLLNKHTDVTLYLVRQGYTFKQQLPLIERMLEEAKLKRLNIMRIRVRKRIRKKRKKNMKMRKKVEKMALKRKKIRKKRRKRKKSMKMRKKVEKIVLKRKKKKKTRRRSRKRKKSMKMKKKVEKIALKRKKIKKTRRTRRIKKKRETVKK